MAEKYPDHRALAEYKIYNNRVPLEDFRRIVLSRYRHWREDGLISHWKHRQALELQICEAVFPGHCTVFPSKKYSRVDI